MLRDAAFTSVARVSVVVEALVPFGVTEAGLNEQVLFAGRPEHVKLVDWLNPPTGVSVSVDVTEPPWLTEPLVGLRDRVKSAAVAAVMVTTTAEEDDAAFAESPPYAAVRLWVPTASVAVERVATPDVRLPVPIDVAPSEKVTVPVGVEVPAVSLTEALKLIEAPETAFVGEAVSCVVVTASVGALAIVRLSGLETDAA